MGLNLDAEQIRKSVGFVTCPGKYKNSDGSSKDPQSASGVVVGSENIVATNAHIFFDASGKVRDPLSECYFQNQGPESQRTPLMLKDGEAGLKEAIKSGLITLGTHQPLEDGVNDWVVVTLKDKIPKLDAFKVNPALMKSLLHGCNGVSDPNCLPMVAVSSRQEQMPSSDQNEPIAQSCRVMDIYPHKDGQATRMMNNCSSTTGSSGSVNFLRDSTGTLIRDSQGHLIPFAIIANGSSKKHDYQPYSLVKDGVWQLNNATMSILIDGPFAQAIEDVEQG